MGDKSEDILFEAYNLGIQDEVLEEAKVIETKYPNMEIGDRFEEALRKIKNKIKND